MSLEIWFIRKSNNALLKYKKVAEIGFIGWSPNFSAVVKVREKERFIHRIVLSMFWTTVACMTGLSNSFFADFLAVFWDAVFHVNETGWSQCKKLLHPWCNKISFDCLKDIQNINSECLCDRLARSCSRWCK